MEVAAFIKKVEQEYDEMPVGLLKPDSKFKEIINWSSINSVVFATMIEFEYHVMVTSEELNSVNTITELFELIVKKQIP
ncbi:MAG: hypothetical protein V4615_03355 [Bacteroidota bacterium]